MIIKMITILCKINLWKIIIKVYILIIFLGMYKKEKRSITLTQHEKYEEK